MVNGLRKYYELEIAFYGVIGNHEKERNLYGELAQKYEYWRYMYQRCGADESEISQWFADNAVPVYKKAAMLSLENPYQGDPFEDTSIPSAFKRAKSAFAYSEQCRGRTLTDHYNDVLVSRSYQLDKAEEEKLGNYRLELAALANSGNNDEYLKLKREEKNYKSLLRQKYSNIIIPYTWATKGKHAYILNKGELYKNFLELNKKFLRFNKKIDSIPDKACFIEFWRISDDSLIVFTASKDHNYNEYRGDGVVAAQITTDKKFYDNLQLYYELNAYTDIEDLHRDGKYFWSLPNDNYVITVGRNAPNSSAKAVNDNAEWLDLRKNLSVEIGRKLFSPFENFLDRYSHWIISPDAELNLIPFETLTYNDKMLIDSADISYVPSLTVLHMMSHRARRNELLGVSKDLFAMGDAIYGDNSEAVSRGSKTDFFSDLRSKDADDFIDIKVLQWSNLPGTGREIDRVSALFENKDIFRKTDATEKNLKNFNATGDLAEYKYLLFATHGLFVPSKPELSAIVLSQEPDNEDNDGYVTITEWMGYDLRSNLVYLSACETGLGDYQSGEGIMGIPYALTLAGNKDTVMSLWKVDDDSTAEFTAAVFEKIKAGKTEVVALNETKREFLKKNNSKYSSPSVWSAFLLYGI